MSVNIMLRSAVGYGLYYRPKFSVRQLMSLAVGSKTAIAKTFTAKEVKEFADITGDNNPIHVNPEYAKTTKFGKPIVHGILANGLHSGLLAKELGEGAVLMTFDSEFLAPVFVGESITAEAEIVEVNGRRVELRLSSYSTDSKKILMQGKCRVLVSKLRVSKVQSS